MLKPAPASAGGGRLRLPLLARMLLLLLPVVVVPLIIVGAVSIRRGTDTVGKTAEQASRSLPRLQRQGLTRYHRGTKDPGRRCHDETVVKACSAPSVKRRDLLPVWSNG